MSISISIGSGVSIAIATAIGSNRCRKKAEVTCSWILTIFDYHAKDWVLIGVRPGAIRFEKWISIEVL